MAAHHCNNLLTPYTVKVSAGVTFSSFKSNPVPWQLKPFPMVSKNPPRTKGLHNPAIPYLRTSSPSVLYLAHSVPAQQLSSCSLNTLSTSGPWHLVSLCLKSLFPVTYMVSFPHSLLVFVPMSLSQWGLSWLPYLKLLFPSIAHPWIFSITLITI